MPVIERKEIRSIRFVPELELVTLGLLGVLTLHAFRVGSHMYPPAMWAEMLVFLAIPVVLFWWMTSKFARSPNLWSSRVSIYAIQASALILAFVFLVVQWISRRSGLGDANEIVLLLVVQYVAWHLIVFSMFGSLGKTGFLLSCSIVLFVCFSAETVLVFVSAFFFAIVALWRLLGDYWTRIDNKALDGQSKTLPVSGLALLATLIVVSLTGAAAWSLAPRGGVYHVRGFSPFSGGETGPEDQLARDGIGDGNRLAAGHNATTTGAVDSDEFIEDDKPSMYDISTEKYSSPAQVKVKKRRNRAVALDEIAKHLHKVVQSEQSGRSFRTVREPPARKRLDLEDKITKALFYVEGSAPARFSIDCFHQFDGWDWSKIDLEAESMPKSKIKYRQTNGKPWYHTGTVRREYLSLQRSHRVKMMRLSTDTVPASSLVRCWHIHRVDVPNMFRWNRQGLPRIDGELIPTHTIIDVVSDVPNYDTLRSTTNLQLVDHPNPIWGAIDIWLGVGSKAGTTTSQCAVVDTPPDSPFLQVPDNGTKETLEQLVEDVSKGHRTGWNQVEAIVNHFRSNYEYDPNRVASADADDSVESFLENQGGPSYLFASTTAQALRVAGYRTRLVSGFLVQQQDFDRRGKQSIVTSDNLHMWPEVCLDGWHWIPVEPTPGFPVPFSHQTWWQFAKSQVIGFFRLINRNPFTSLFLLTLTVMVVRTRRELAVVASWLYWSMVGLMMPSRQLAATRKMLDIRFWAAGIPRPSFATIADWFLRVDDQASADFFRLWQLANFSASATRSHQHEIDIACRQISHDLSFRKIKDFATKLSQVST